VLESSKELWALLEPVLQSSLAAPSPALDGPEGLERLPREAVEAVQQYSPGLQTVADAFRTELLALAESRAHELTRGSVALNSASAFSTGEGGLCAAAYEIMARVFTVGAGFGVGKGFAAVPECSPEGLDMFNAFHTSCGSCYPTTCPVMEHFAVPLYADTPSLLAVAEEVLENQQAILCREQGSGSCAELVMPTEPLANVPSGELDKLFPSTALHFKTLDLDKVQINFEITSFWGDLASWPFLVAPTEWSLPAAQTTGSYRNDFTMIKFPRGGLDFLSDRITYAGGFSSMMTNWATNAVLKSAVDPSLSVTTSMKPFPFVLDFDFFENEQQAASGVVGLFGILVDLITPPGCTVLTFYFLTLQVVQEKEHRLRALMVMMGLDMKYYWLWEYLFNSAITFTAFVAFWGLGVGYGLDFMVRSSTVALLLMLIWSQCMVAMSMFYSCFFSRQLWSTIILILYSIILGLLSFVVNQFILFRSTDTWPVEAFLVMPFFAFFRGINLLNKRTYSPALIDGEMATVLVSMVISTVGHFVLAMYIDQVMPREFGVTRHPLFCVTWMCKEKAPEGVSPDADEDDDVAAERRAVEEIVRERAKHAATSSTSSTSSTFHPIETVSLRKVYKGGKVAVHNQTFKVHDDECFGLLGPNGAGKTTTISILTGLYPPTAGNATVCGFDIRTQMSKVYEAMGVCPQFDILWPLLTVGETLRFYCKLKAVPPSEWSRTVGNAVASVDLSHARHRRVGRLSGGMKRRVSLAISLIGNPKVVFLDEPTTGLDPETKRAMWTLVDMAKSGRAIVLTTHSMEEADALCGRIGIMAYGRMRCLGTSLHLKDKFGEGYKIDVTYREGASGAVAAFVAQVVPGSRIIGDFNNTATFMVPSAGGARLSTVFEVMKARPDDVGIVDWALRQTSMEEVFLRIAHASEVAQTRELEHEAAAKTTSKVAMEPKVIEA